MMRYLTLALLLAAPLAHAHDASEPPRAAAAPATSADDAETFGATMPDGEAMPLDAALAAFDPAQTGPQKFSGRIVDVCEKRGCWAKLEVDGQSARVMPRDYDFMVPRDVRGPAVVYGTLTSADLSESAAEYAKANPGKPNPVPTQEYRIDALSVVLLEQDG